MTPHSIAVVASRPTLRCWLLSLAAAVAAGCSQPDLTAPAESLADAKGGKPGGGGDGGGTAVPAIDLGTLGGRSSNPSAINGAGYVVGRADRTDGRSVAFIWREAVGMQELTNAHGAESSYPYDINAGNTVVGLADFDLDPTVTALRAVTWSFDGGGWGVPTALPALTGLEGTSAANALNDAGDIVGMNYPPASGTGTVVVWQLGVPQAVLSGDAGTNYYANDISNGGWIVGHLKDRAINLNTAFVWIPDAAGQYASGRLIPLPRVGDGNHSASAVGDGGVVVGYAGAVGSTVAVRWLPQTSAPDGPEDFVAEVLPGNYASAVNADGYIAGQRPGKGGWADGFMWAPDGTATALAAGKNGHTEPFGINASRWIIGRSGIRATLWKAP